MNKEIKVSIIIATYGAESWIERCAHSLFSQTMHEGLEYIFVDDFSNDKSIEVMCRVLEEYPFRKDQVQIVKHDKNLGVAAARITGMKSASGEYLIHCDPDDWIEPNMYENMYNLAKEKNADIVMCNFLIENEMGVVSKRIIPQYRTPQEYIEKYASVGEDLAYLFNKLVKRDIIVNNNLYPPQGINLGEDANITLKVFYYANNVVLNNNYYYHYCIINAQSLSKKKDNLANVDMLKRNTDDIVSFLKGKGIKKYRTTANFFKYITKLKLLIAQPSNIDYFYNTYKDCRRDIFKFKCRPIKVRIIHACMLYSKFFLKHYLKHKNII